MRALTVRKFVRLGVVPSESLPKAATDARIRPPAEAARVLLEDR
jgi:hypothetical protein